MYLFFFFFFHITSKIQQNKTTDTHSTSQGPIKREGEREGQQKHKSHSFIQLCTSTKKHCQASMVEGLAPPTRTAAHPHDTIRRRPRIQHAFPHMCGANQLRTTVFLAAAKPANNILLCIEPTQRPESLSRRHKLGSTDQSTRSNDDKTRSTCVHRPMTTGHSQNTCRKVPDDAVPHTWQFKLDCSFTPNPLQGAMHALWMTPKRTRRCFDSKTFLSSNS